MRIVDYTSIALKDLRRQSVRTGLTLAALVISTVILVIMVAISIGGRQAIIDQFGSDEALATMSVTPNQSNSALSPYGNIQEVQTNAGKLDDRTVERLAKLPYVRSASPRAHIWEFASFVVAGSDKRFVAQAEGVPSDAPLRLSAGARFATNDDKSTVVLGYAYAKELGYIHDPHALVGKTIQITTQKGYRGAGADIPKTNASRQANESFNQVETTLAATIVGITDNGPDQSSIFVPIGWAHDVRTARYYEPGGLKSSDQIASSGYTTIQVKADQPAHVSIVAASIKQLGYGQLSALAQVERLQQLSATVWVILGSVAVVAVVAAALGVVNTMLMSVSEQRYAIGVWRACGARKSFIVNLFLAEAGILGLIGGIIGVGIGVFVSQFVNGYVGSLLKSQELTITNIAVIPPELMLGTVLLATVFSILAGLYPAYQAARQDPSSALSNGQ
jgi:putative ABC transport system permease protein